MKNMYKYFAILLLQRTTCRDVAAVVHKPNGNPKELCLGASCVARQRPNPWIRETHLAPRLFTCQL